MEGKAIRGMRELLKQHSANDSKRRLNALVRADDPSSLLSELDNQGSDFLHKIQRVEAAAKGQKRQHNRRTKQFDWKKENTRLATICARAERELVQSIDAIALDGGGSGLDLALQDASDVSAFIVDCASCFDSDFYDAAVSVFETCLVPVHDPAGWLQSRDASVQSERRRLLMDIHNMSTLSHQPSIVEDKNQQELLASLLEAAQAAIGVNSEALELEYNCLADSCDIARKHVFSQADVGATRTDRSAGPILSVEDVWRRIDEIHPGTPDGVRLQVLEDISGAQEEYVHSIESAELDWVRQCTALGVSTTVPPEGWTKPQQLVFSKVMKQLTVGKQATVTRKTLVTSVASELPDKSKQDILLYDTWTKGRSQYRQRRADAESQLQRTLAEVWERSAQRIQTTMKREADRQELRSNLEQSKQQQLKLQSRLRVLHDKKAVQQREQELQQAEAKSAAQAQAELEAARAARMRAIQQAELAAQRAEAEAQAEKAAEARRELEALEAVRHRRELEEAKRRTAVREEMRQEKIAEHEAEIEKLKAAEKAMQERLEAIAASVPYKEAIDAIEIDTKRLQSHTELSALNEELGKAHLEYRRHIAEVGERAAPIEGSSEVAKRQLIERGPYQVAGYRDKQIFSDVRFKINLALQAAGLSGSSAGMALMSQWRQNVPAVMRPSAGSPFFS